MKKLIYLTAALVLLIGLCACTANNPNKNSGAGSSIDVNSLPPNDQTGYFNAKSIMLVRPEGWSKIVQTPPVSEYDLNRIDGSTATIPITAELMRQFYNYTDEQVQQCAHVWHSTTHYAYLNLIEKENKARWQVNAYPQSPMEGANECSTDIIFVTPPSDEELQYAKDKGVTLDMQPVAMDGFVFITHKNNPIDSLTVEQIQDIYSGKITNWKQVGGQDLAITAYQREPNSGSQTAMEKLVMQGKPLIPAIETKIDGMAFLIDAVAEYQNGPASIGYTYYYYINNLYKSDDIKVIKVNGVTPENKNLIDGSYPFSTSYYAIIRGDEPAGSPARKLRDYLLTDEGQDVIRMAGYCGIKK